MFPHSSKIHYQSRAAGIDFIHPLGEYDHLTKIVGRLEELLNLYAQDEVINIHFDMKDYKGSIIKTPFQNSPTYTTGLKDIKKFFTDETIHSQILSGPLMHTIEILEYRHLAHPLKFDNRIIYQGAVIEHDYSYAEVNAYHPFGSYEKSPPILKMILDKMNLFASTSNLHIYYIEDENTHKNTLEIYIHNRTKTDYTLNNRYDIENSHLFETNCEYHDICLSQALIDFNQKIDNLPDYQYYKNKIDLYEKISHELSIKPIISKKSKI